MDTRLSGKRVEIVCYPPSGGEEKIVGEVLEVADTFIIIREPSGECVDIYYPFDLWIMES